MLLHLVLQLIQRMQGEIKHVFQETTVTKNGKRGFEYSLILEPIGQHFFSVRGQRVNILGFAAHTVSVTITQLCRLPRSTIDSM